MGGAEKVTIELANDLAEHNNVFLIDFSGENEFYYKVSSRVKVLKQISRQGIISKLVWYLARIFYKITKININPKYIYGKQIRELNFVIQKNQFNTLILSQGLLTSMIPFIKCNNLSPQIIAWQHNNYDIYINKYYKKLLKYYLCGLKLADSIVCLTQFDQQKFKDLNLNSYYIYNPLTIMSPKITTLKNKNIIFASRLVAEQKGLDILMQIIKNIEPEWKVLIAGDGPDRKMVQEEIDKNNLENRCRLIGNLNSSEMENLYKSGSIFISTSRWEGFGLSITEAMAAGLPIVSFENIGPNEILDYGKYGILINKYNIEDFVAKLNMLAKSYELRKYWSKRSLLRAKDFGKEKVLKKWSDLLRNRKRCQ
ncbi:glycosyltransferase [Sporolactobacillus terrae]|uniref:glycosyltransferase n=1 Tax=Sporolactobacillus terrae TaxID=269673 RepID=UPI0018CC5FDB|nr:glycosyltransferase [Sporolactobacillus terrae]